MSEVRSSMEQAQTQIAVRRELRGAAILVVLLVVPIAAFAVLVAAFTGGSADSGETEAASSSSQAAASGGDAAEGETIFASTCAACHGADAEGVEGLGLPLAGSEFVASTADADLVVFIGEGREVDAPENTTGVAMPPNGGDSSLTEEQVASVAAYIKSLNE